MVRQIVEPSKENRRHVGHEFILHLTTSTSATR